MIEAKKVFEEFQKHRENAIVSVQGTSGKHWKDISTNQNRDISLGGAMGQSTSAVFGLALGLKNEKVVHFDSEGALLMNLGVIASIAGKQPKNFVHFVLDNGCYATTGGQPVPNSESIDYAQMAAGAGYSKTYNFDDLEDLKNYAYIFKDVLKDKIDDVNKLADKVEQSISELEKQVLNDEVAA